MQTEKSKYALFGLLVLLVGLVVGYCVGTQTDSHTHKDHEEMHSKKMMMNENGMAMEDIDRYFIENMIPHHEGAIMMAQIAQPEGVHEEIQSLAKNIIDAQTAEIERMKGWYQAWFGKAPSVSEHTMHMEGMEGDSEALKSANDFDVEFIDQMIPHHEIAIMMANMIM